MTIGNRVPKRSELIKSFFLRMRPGGLSYWGNAYVGAVGSHLMGYGYHKRRGVHHNYIDDWGFVRTAKGVDPLHSFSSKSDMPPTPKPTPKRGRSRQRSTSAKRTGSVGGRRMSIDPPAGHGNFRSFGTQTARAPRGTGSRPVHSTSAGYVGSFKRPKKVKRKRSAKFDIDGLVIKREHNGTVADAEAAYVGHGTPAGTTLLTIWGAIYRKVCAEAGYDFKSWQDTFANGSDDKVLIQVRYTIGDGTTGTSVFNYAVDVLDTHYGIASALYGLATTAVTDANSQKAWQFKEIQLMALDEGAATSTSYPLARVSLENMFCDYEYWSILKVKNVTIGDDATNANLTTNVEAQPLVGKVYETTKWANGFELKRDNTGDAVAQLVGHPGFGDIFCGAVQLDGLPGPTRNPYAKPPPAYLFGVTKQATARINPGEVKTNVIKWKCKMTVNALFNLLLTQLNQPGNQELRLFGKAALLGLERDVKITTDTTTQIKLMYQVDYICKAKCTIKKGKAMPVTITDDA